MRISHLLALGIVACASFLRAQPSEGKKITREEFEKSLKYQTGKVELSGGMASLNLGPEFRFLAAADARRVLEDAWGNPPDESVLGMLFPANLSPLADGGWGVIVTYDTDGFVKDDEADKINYSEMLADMKKDTVGANEERKKAGYGTVELIGWATPPHYDKNAKKLYWAKELKFEGGSENTLNYNIRALGRRGVLVLNAVAGKSQLAAVEKEMPKLLPMLAFNEGHRYSDFIPGTDSVAAYGIGALVAGKIALKVGLFKWLIALLFASKKLIVIAALGGGAAIKGLLGLRKKDERIVAEITPPPADAPSA